MIKAIFLSLFLLFSTSAFCQNGVTFPKTAYQHHLKGVESLKAQDWSSADQSFSEAHEAYRRWADKNGVDVYREPLFEQNLDYWVGVKMVTNELVAVLIFEELEVFGARYSKSLLDFRVISSLDSNFENENLKKYERGSEDLKKEVFSSRMLYALLNNSKNIGLLKSMYSFLKEEEDTGSELVITALGLIIAVHDGDDAKADKQMSKVLESLKNKFLKKPLGSFRVPVLETLTYIRIFDVFALELSSDRLKKEIVNVYISPKK